MLHDCDLRLPSLQCSMRSNVYLGAFHMGTNKALSEDELSKMRAKSERVEDDN